MGPNPTEPECLALRLLEPNTLSLLLELAQIRRLDYFDKFVGNYAEGESKRTAISKLNLFLEDMGFKAKEVKGDDKLLDIKERCNLFCKQFKEIGENRSSGL